MKIYRGWNAKIFMGGMEIGYVDEVRVEIDHSLEYYFEAGQRIPAMIMEGPLNIKGRFSKAWVNRDYLQLLASSTVLSSFTLRLALTVGPPPHFNLFLYNCKLGRGSISVPQDGILTEDYDFLATSFALSS